MATTRTPFDVDALRRGIEERDADALIGLYAQDAESSTVDRDHPPSTPRVLHGVDEIAADLRDVYGRDMTHQLERIVVDGDHAAFVQSCRYADGTRVLCSAALDLRDGLIARQTVVQAWDA